MNQQTRTIVISLLAFLVTPAAVQAAADKKDAASQPTKVYIPYKELGKVFEKKGQGVFLPYEEFHRLWRAAQGHPAEAAPVPMPYLISTARFKGKVSAKLATMTMDLTIDVLADGWVQVPIGLGEVAVAQASVVQGADKAPGLLRIVGGEYVLVTRGKGRRVLKVDFVRQLITKPGLNVLSYRMPAAAISTLDLTIPEADMKVDVDPMRAATTQQEGPAGKKVTRLQAFLGTARAVKLSWKPKTQAAAELEPVVICEQFHHVQVDEALIRHEVRLDYDVRRRGVGSFTIQLPGGFRVTAVNGENIRKWDVKAAPDAGAGANAKKPQTLVVELFAPVKDKYTLTIQTEKFLKEADATLPLEPVITRKVVRRTGLIAITRSNRRSVELRGLKNLARVDTGRLPKAIRGLPGATAYRFITADYGATLVIGTVLPRITVRQLWALDVDDDRLELRGELKYRVERAGVFQVAMDLPEPWQVVSVGPASTVHEHQLQTVGQGAKKTRRLNVLLKRELTGDLNLSVLLRGPRGSADEAVKFVLPLADEKNLQLYTGQFVLSLAGRFRAEVEKLAQLQSIPLNQAEVKKRRPAMAPTMAFEFSGIDRGQPAGADFRIAVKPAQVSAVVHRLVNIQPGSVQQDAVVQFKVQYAPVEKFYLKVPKWLADKGIQINGADIKEKPRIDKLPPDQLPAPAKGAAKADDAAGWAYYKVVLQSPRMGVYELTVGGTMRPLDAGKVGTQRVVRVAPILAAGRIANQSGHVAVTKADTLAIGKPKISNLVPADPGSEADVPYAAHRKGATMAFKYNTPAFELSLPVTVQEEAAVFTTIARAAVIEQVLSRDGRLNARAAFLLATSRGDRLPINLPEDTKLFSVLLNGAEAPVEPGANPRQRIVRLPPSAGQVTHLVLEISYGQDDASATNLTAPTLPKDVPVQQTLWRVWLAGEDVLVWHDRNFSRLGPREAGAFLTQSANREGRSIEFKLQAQGESWDFLRPGAPGKLSLQIVDREYFTIGVWIVVLLVGVVLLKCSLLCRCVVILAAALAVSVVHLFCPLLVGQATRARVSLAPVAIVLVLWLVHGLFVMVKREGRRRKPQQPTEPPPPAEPATEPLPPAEPPLAQAEPPQEDKQDPPADPAESKPTPQPRPETPQE